MNVIETERLILRTWRDDDAQGFFNINQDPKVIEFLRGPLTKEQVQDFITFVVVRRLLGDWLLIIGAKVMQSRVHAPC